MINGFFGLSLFSVLLSFFNTFRSYFHESFHTGTISNFIHIRDLPEHRHI